MPICTLYNDVTKEPIHIARLLRDDIVVRRYRMPEKVGVLYTPAADGNMFGYDRTQTLWEVVAGNPKADEAIGMHIPTGCIVQTLRRFPRDLHATDEDGRPCFVLSAEASGIRGVIVWQDQE